MAKTLVGEIAHYYGKIGVAALKLTGALNEGDRISVETKEGAVLFEQSVDSMQVNHAPVQSAKAGDDVAIRLSAKAHAGNLVYRVSE